jgi:FKBP-type peptidyl-prolyl cis-trans isomerase
MNVGSKYKLYIPHELAYGTNDMGHIPGGSVLVFEVELLNIPGKN